MKTFLAHLLLLRRWRTFLQCEREDERALLDDWRWWCIECSRDDVGLDVWHKTFLKWPFSHPLGLMTGCGKSRATCFVLTNLIWLKHKKALEQSRRPVMQSLSLSGEFAWKSLAAMVSNGLEELPSAPISEWAHDNGIHLSILEMPHFSCQFPMFPISSFDVSHFNFWRVAFQMLNSHTWLIEMSSVQCSTPRFDWNAYRLWKSNKSCSSAQIHSPDISRRCFFQMMHFFLK